MKGGNMGKHETTRVKTHFGANFMVRKQSRLKEHLIGKYLNVTRCPNVLSEVAKKLKDMVDNVRKEREEKRRLEEEKKSEHMKKRKRKKVVKKRTVVVVLLVGGYATRKGRLLKFQILRDLIPQNDQKRDKASFLLEVIEYIQFLQEKVHKYEASYQGWSQEPTKLTPWVNSNLSLYSQLSDLTTFVRNGHGIGETIFDHSRAMKQRKFEENSVSILSGMLTNAQNPLESDLSTSTAYKPMEHQIGIADMVVPLPVSQSANTFPTMLGSSGLTQPPQGPMYDGDNMVSQSEDQVMLSRPTECPDTNETLIEQEELTIEGGTISIAGAYSQGLCVDGVNIFDEIGLDVPENEIASCSPDFRRLSSDMFSPLRKADWLRLTRESITDFESFGEKLRNDLISVIATIESPNVFGLGIFGTRAICAAASRNILEIAYCLAGYKVRILNSVVAVASGGLQGSLINGKVHLIETRAVLVGVTHSLITHKVLFAGLSQGGCCLSLMWDGVTQSRHRLLAEVSSIALNRVMAPLAGQNSVGGSRFDWIFVLEDLQLPLLGGIPMCCSSHYWLLRSWPGEEGDCSTFLAIFGRLLNNLTQALQSLGVDVSQASISVQVDYGKRAINKMSTMTCDDKDHEDPSSSIRALTHSRDPTSGEDSDLPQKRIKTGENPV
ncbi:hypothetical protein GIB67_038641 [Kingdonia uniflora]|uniref:BHLH domain-containing protein n=1 Tax=Kingdonia uniflora TaxID=39325 RepID=A0A7J7NQ96_9MAGN|nr:hypothetical protein GIB67_038641 [Kingdonia uniflora]